MKKLLVLVLTINYFISSSQSLDIKWSEQFAYNNKIDGFFDSYVGSTEDLIYAKFSNYAVREKKKDKKVKLVVFDKKTMAKVGSVELKGYPGHEHEDLKYFKTIVLDKIVYVAWFKEAKNKKEYYVQSFDNKLKKLNKLTKIYDLIEEKGRKDQFTILSNKNANNQILILKEFGITHDDESVKIEYKVLNSDLSFGSVHQVVLPIMYTKFRRFLVKQVDFFKCDYEFGDDGNIYVQDIVTKSKDEISKHRRVLATTYPYFIQVNAETGNYKDFMLTFEGKNTFKSRFLIDKNKIKIYGFFSDLSKDMRGSDTHGIFYITMDLKSFSPSENHFSYFTKSFLDELYASDKENQKKGKGLFKSKKDKISDDESISNQYRIEQTISEGDNLVLFCSIMNNYTEQVCTTNTAGVTHCTTYYYCEKSNVTTFKLDSKGNIIWAKNMDRLITYSGWDVYDVSVVRDSKNYFVVYGSDYDRNSTKKNFRSHKSKKEAVNLLEYAIFSASTGDFRKTDYQINNLNTTKKTRKEVNEADIYVTGNKMFVNCTRSKLKPATYLSCVCPCLFFALSRSGNMQKGTGYLGAIAASGQLGNH